MFNAGADFGPRQVEDCAECHVGSGDILLGQDRWDKQGVAVIGEAGTARAVVEQESLWLKIDAEEVPQGVAVLLLRQPGQGDPSRIGVGLPIDGGDCPLNPADELPPLGCGWQWFLRRHLFVTDLLQQRLPEPQVIDDRFGLLEPLQVDPAFTVFSIVAADTVLLEDRPDRIRVVLLEADLGCRDRPCQQDYESSCRDRRAAEQIGGMPH